MSLAIVAVLVCGACGIRGTPQPPARPARLSASQLTAVQRGPQIVLTWSPSIRRSSGRLDRVDIYRLTEPRTVSPSRTSLDDFRESANVIGTVPIVGPAGAQQIWSDPLALNLGNRLDQERLLYSIVYVNGEGQSLGFSDLATVEPVSKIPDPPGQAKSSLSQDAITLTWQPPDKNIDGTPANPVGYNVYRSTLKPAPDQASGATNVASGLQQALNPELINATEFKDRSFEFGAEYSYIVRSLTNIRGHLIESADSTPLVIKPIDTFAPAAPSSVTIASANSTISLFWPSNSEPDVAGYNVYRADAADTPVTQWVKLNGALLPHPPTSFTDTHVQVGKRYYYQITAVDRFGNESPRSEPVSEEVNP